jgi:hypothetical protein
METDLMPSNTVSVSPRDCSPLPWSIGVRQYVDDECDLAIGDATDWVVARAGSESAAELIVRAVNVLPHTLLALAHTLEFLSTLEPRNSELELELMLTAAMVQGEVEIPAGPIAGDVPGA